MLNIQKLNIYSTLSKILLLDINILFYYFQGTILSYKARRILLLVGSFFLAKLESSMICFLRCIFWHLLYLIYLSFWPYPFGELGCLTFCAHAVLVVMYTHICPPYVISIILWYQLGCVVLPSDFLCLPILRFILCWGSGGAILMKHMSGLSFFLSGFLEFVFIIISHLYWNLGYLHSSLSWYILDVSLEIWLSDGFLI